MTTDSVTWNLFYLTPPANSINLTSCTPRAFRRRVISFFVILNFLHFLDAISLLRFSRKRSTSGNAREYTRVHALRHIFSVSNSHDW